MIIRSFVALLAGALVLAAPACAPPPFEQRLQRARDLIDQGHYPEAVRESKALLKEAEGSAGLDSALAADAIEVLVKALRIDSKGGSPETEALARRGLAIRERLRGPDDPGVAAMLQVLGEVMVDRNDLRQAVTVFERALAILEKTLGPGDPRVAGILIDLSYQQSTMDASKRMAERALAIAERATGPDSLLTADSLTALGSFLSDLGSFQEGRTVLERALGIYEKILRPDHPRIAACLQTIGYLFIGANDFRSARPPVERAIAIMERTEPDSKTMASLVDREGVVLAETGDLPGAIEAFRRSAAMMTRFYGPASLDAAMTRNRLGIALLMSGEFIVARQEMERALATITAVAGPDDVNAIYVMNNLGFLLVNMGEYAAARPLLERAYSKAAQVFGRDTPDYAELGSSLGDLELMSGSLPRARTLYEQARAIFLKRFGPDHPSAGRIQLSLGRVDLLAGRPSAALAKALLCERIARAAFLATARSLTEKEALRYEAIRVSGLDLAFTALAARPESSRSSHEVRLAWDALIRSRSMVLDEIIARHRRASESIDLAKPVRRLNDVRDRLAKLIARGPSPGAAGDYPAQLRAAQAEEEAAERAVAVVSSSYREIQEMEAVDLSAVRRALPEKTALVGYVVYSQMARPATTRGTVLPRGDVGPRDLHARGQAHYAALVLGTGSVEPVFVPLGLAAPIEAAVRAWRDAAAARQDPLARADGAAELAYRAAAEPLRRLVWDPVLPALRGARQVFIAPDGALSLVSFGSLPAAAGRYLVESGPIVHELSEEKDAVVRRRDPGLGLLALGGPDFDAAPGVATATRSGVGAGAADRLAAYRGPLATCSDLRTMRFSPLPQSSVEVQELASLWADRVGSTRGPLDGEAVALVGAASTEGAVKAGVRGRRVVHLATHGFVAGGDCASSFGDLQGAKVALAAQDLLGVVGDDPLLLSGLALAGANRRSEVGPDEEDGILTAQEIASLDFSQTEWVVLSACETGVGKVQSGEGILGLRRAFETAGAGTLIMSLWPVEDEATRRWMKALYEARLSGRTTAESVREASLSILGARQREGKSTHPFFWGAFVAAGDWR